MEECQSEIQQFYNGETILITGGTGFMGKVLLEKLLRTCFGIKKIYLMIRPKKNASSEERLNKLFSNKVFSVLLEQQPNFKEKVVAISGDCALPKLGISEDDRKKIIQEVSIIFHMAATTRFDETIAKAIQINVISVKYIIDLCSQMKNFKAGTYVSTAYSNCLKHEIEEKVYDGPLNYEECVVLAEIVKKQSWDNDDKELITKKFIGNWPNSYTFTKAVAEKTIDDYARNLPFCITRPSIVLSTYREPIQGWNDNLVGPSGLITGVGIGIIHALLMDDEKKADLVPCDTACNSIIASVWETGTNKRRSVDSIPVYNYVNKGRTTWGDLLHYCMKYLAKYPSVYIFYHPCTIQTTSMKVYEFYQFFFMCIPAIIIDMLAKFKGQKQIMYKIYKTGKKHNTMLKFFSLSEWKFSHKKTDALWENMNAKDKQLFPFLIDNINWNNFFEIFVLGLRESYIEKLLNAKLFSPRDDSLEKAKKHWNKLTVIHWTLMATLFLILCWLLYTVFYGVINLLS